MIALESSQLPLSAWSGWVVQIQVLLPVDSDLPMRYGASVGTLEMVAPRNWQNEPEEHTLSNEEGGEDIENNILVPGTGNAGHGIVRSKRVLERLFLAGWVDNPFPSKCTLPELR
ncbi:MAG: hypothetical protein ACUVRS_12610 [Armatimonadota bacterium]